MSKEGSVDKGCEVWVGGQGPEPGNFKPKGLWLEYGSQGDSGS